MRRTILITLTAIAGLTIISPPAEASVASVKATIRREAHRQDYGRGNTRALVVLAGRESTWRPWVKNGSCWGLFQLGPAARRHARKHYPRWRWCRALDNTRGAILYIKGRYGTPRKALAHSYAYGWY